MGWEEESEGQRTREGQSGQCAGLGGVRLGPVLAATEWLCVPFGKSLLQSWSYLTGVEAEPELSGAIQLLLLCEEGCDGGQAGWALLSVFCGSPRKAGLPTPGVSLSLERQGWGSNTMSPWPLPVLMIVNLGNGEGGREGGERWMGAMTEGNQEGKRHWEGSGEECGKVGRREESGDGWEGGPG